MIFYFLSLTLILSNCECSSGGKQKRELLIYTTASEETDGYYRFLRSLRVNGLKPQKIFGLGGNFTGMGIKVKLFREEVEKYKNRSDVVVLFTDSYDAVFCAGEEEILKAFDDIGANIVFSTETNCWPRGDVKDLYPEVKTGYRFLNSGGIIGYAPQIYQMLPELIGDTDDDQYYYTRVFLEEEFRTSLGIALDTQASIFQSLHGVEENLTLHYRDDDTRLFNKYTNTTPCIIHANGFTKIRLHLLSSYLAKSWTKSKGCLACNEDRINVEALPDKDYPIILIGFFIERPTPFLREKLDKMHRLRYPKNKLFLFVYNRIFEHEALVTSWLHDYAAEYMNVKYLWRVPDANEGGNDGKARAMAIKTCVNISCDLYFSIDSFVNIENPETLRLLISYNRNIMAPIMTDEVGYEATFWGSIAVNLEYQESFNYHDIITNKIRGFWNIPQVHHIYVLWRFSLENPNFDLFLASEDPPDIAIAVMFITLKHYSMFIFASNLHDYGYLSNMESVFVDNLHNDLWQVATNSKDWENRYLHPNFSKHFNKDFSPEMECINVYMFPLFTNRFCKEMIETMEHFGQWSSGQNDDPRLHSGYENIPSVDIMMEQIGYEKEWRYIIQKYIKPVVEKFFPGYRSQSKSLSSFVVRYTKPHPSLKPHEDHSTFTISVGLNNPGQDFEGGGTKFLRYNCTTKEVPAGWVMIHPGRLTHYHEEIRIRNGTKYSLNSYVDPT